MQHILGNQAEDRKGTLRDLEAKLNGPRGGWWLRKLKRMLRGELVGNNQTILKTIKTGIKVQGGVDTLPLCLFFGKPEDFFSGLPMELSPNVICNLLVPASGNFRHESWPDLNLSISLLTRRDLTPKNLVDVLGDDAFVPFLHISNFLRFNLRPHKSYLFPVLSPKEETPAIMWVEKAWGGNGGKDEGNKWNMCYLGIADHPITYYPDRMCVVHLDYLSRENEDAFTMAAGDKMREAA